MHPPRSTCRLLVCRPRIPADARRLQRSAAAFLARHPDGHVVCFDLQLSSHLSGARISYWREWLTPSTELALSEQGHAIIDSFLAATPPGMRGLLQVARSSLGAEAFRAMAIAHCLSGAGGPVLAVVDPPQPLAIALRLLPLHSNRTLFWLCRQLSLTSFALLPLGLLRFYLRSQFYDFRSAIRWKRWRDAWQAISGTPARIAQWQREISESDRQALCPSPPAADILLVVEDSGSGLNWVPARDILETIRVRGHSVTVATSTIRVAEDCHALGIAATLVATDPMLPNHRLMRQVRAIVRRLTAWADTATPRGAALAVATAILPHLRRHTLMAMSQRRIAFRLLAHSGAQVTVGINEAIPLCISIAAAARRLGRPCILHLPALIFDHPESRAFPDAWRHLVYGDQSRELLIRAGCPAERVISVGTALFDQTLRGSRAGDSERIHALLPGWQQQKLVVIGTEHRAKQVDDIRAVLQGLAGHPGILIVIKVHPADSEDQFRRLAAEFAGQAEIAVVGRCDLDALLSCADLLICQRSNIIITAALLQTPVLICDFFGSDSIFDFAREGLGHKCPAPDQVWPEVRALVFEPMARANLLRRQAAGLHRFNGPNDGRSAGRIVDAIEAAMRQRYAR